MRVRLESRQLAAGLRLGSESEFREHQLGETFGIVDVGGGGRRVPRSVRARAAKRQRHPARLRRLRVAGDVTLVGSADLEHAHRGRLAAQVRADHAEQTLERVRAQGGGVLRQRVEQLQRAGRAQRAGAHGIAERVRHALAQAGSDEHLAHGTLLAPAVAVPRQRHAHASDRRRYAVVAPDADHLFDEIVLDGEVAPEARHAHLEVGAARAHAEPQAGQDPSRLRGGRGHAQHALHARHAQAYAHGTPLARIDVDHAPRDDAAGQLGHEPCRARRRVDQSLDVGAALEAIGGIGLQAERARGPPRRARIEVRALEEHARGGLGDLAVLAAHHAREPDRALGIGDHAHRGVERAPLPVQRGERLGRSRAAYDDRRVRHARSVEGVEWMSELPQHVVGDVDDVGDRT